MPASSDPLASLSAHIADADFGRLSGATRTATCRDLLDTIAVTLGGSGAPGIAPMVALARHWGGRPEAAVPLHGLRVPAPQAASIVAAMAHALDYDDTHDAAGAIHPGAPVLGAALATAQAYGPVDGERFVVAVALGLDVACRIALAAHVDRGWHRTAAIGVFGATAAAAHLLRLDAPRAAHALGIALSHAAGTRQCIVDGALTKRLQAGIAASAGVTSALLARDGFTGALEPFTGRYGFGPMYQPDGFDADRILEGLGTRWEGDALSLKPYPCFRPGHAAIEAALAVRASLRAPAFDAIQDVLIESDTRQHAEQFEGGAHKRAPRHAVDAQFATPYLVATALARGRVGIDEVAAHDDPASLAIAARTCGAAVDGVPWGWARVSVTLVDGRSVTHEVARASGSPQRPLDDAALRAKLLDCAAHALRPLSAETCERLTGFVSTLPAQRDATAWLDLLDQAR